MRKRSEGGVFGGEWAVRLAGVWVGWLIGWEVVGWTGVL